MKILCLAFIEPDYPQIYRKFAHQVEGLRHAGYEVEGVVLGSPGIDLTPLGLRHVSHPYDRTYFFAACTSLVETLAPDVVYFRYPLADAMLHRFIQRIEGRVVFEHNTMELNEISGECLDNELRWGARCRSMAAGLVGVTEEILSHQQSRSERTMPGIAIANGRSPEGLPPCDGPADANEIHLFCAARFAPWHGMDRIIDGLAAYSGPVPVMLHLAGDGDVLGTYRQRVENQVLQDKVVFHGHLGREDLTRLAECCHAALGSLAYHRIGLGEISALKHREYAVQGIPFVYAGKDMDFPPNLPFVHVVTLDESPVNIEAIVRFALATHATKDQRCDERKYAMEHLGWNIKMAALGTFLESIVPHTLSSTPGQPLVSVVIPCYNQARFLPDSFGSIVRQTWRDLEVIVVDDGSTDDTADVAAELFARHPDLPARLVRQDNRGLSEARNAGIRAARGQWILTLDADDMFRRDFLAHAMDQLQQSPELNMIYSPAQQFGQTKDIWDPREFFPEQLKEENTFPCAALFRKSLWEDAGGYDPSHPWGIEDWNFWIRCTRVGIVTRKLPKPYLLYRTHAGGSMYTRMMAHWDEATAMNQTMLADIYGIPRVLAAHARLARMSPQSEERIRHKIAQWPDLSLPHLWLGLTHEGRGEFGEAMACYLRSAALAAPDDWQPHLRLMLVNRHIGRTQAAKAARQECLRRAPALQTLLSAVQDAHKSTHHGAEQTHSGARP